MELERQHAVAEVDEARARVPPDDALAVLRGLEDLQSGTRRRHAAVAEARRAARRAPRSTSGGTGAPPPAASRTAANADRVPDLERPDLPAEPPSHRAIDVVDRVRDVGRDARRVDERRPERLAQERADAVAAEEERADALARVVDAARGFERRQRRRPLRAVGHRRRVEREDLPAAWRSSRACRSRGPPSRRSTRARRARRRAAAGRIRARASPVGRRSARLPITCARMSTPAMSIVRNVALFGRPSAGPVIASISSIVYSPRSSTRRIWSTPWRPMWFAMKFGVSRATTTPLPRRTSAKRATRSTTAGSVSAVGMSSRRCRYRGGLKKCVPSHDRRKSSERPSASAAMGMPDVLDVVIVPAPARGVHAGEQRALDVDLLDDGFDDPVDVLEPRQPGRRSRRSTRATRRPGVKNGSGLSARARSRPDAREPRREVEEQRRHAGVGEVRGDLRAHRAGAENSSRANHAQIPRQAPVSGSGRR